SNAIKWKTFLEKIERLLNERGLEVTLSVVKKQEVTRKKQVAKPQELRFIYSTTSDKHIIVRAEELEMKIPLLSREVKYGRVNVALSPIALDSLIHLIVQEPNFASSIFVKYHAEPEPFLESYEELIRFADQYQLRELKTQLRK